MMMLNSNNALYKEQQDQGYTQTSSHFVQNIYVRCLLNIKNFQQDYEPDADSLNCWAVAVNSLANSPRR